MFYSLEPGGCKLVWGHYKGWLGCEQLVGNIDNHIRCMHCVHIEWLIIRCTYVGLVGLVSYWLAIRVTHLDWSAVYIGVTGQLLLKLNISLRVLSRKIHFGGYFPLFTGVIEFPFSMTGIFLWALFSPIREVWAPRSLGRYKFIF